MTTKYTAKTAAAVCKRLLRAAKDGCHEIARYSWTDTHGNQCFCDGHRAYRLRSPLPGMPTLPEHLTAFDLSGVFKPLGDGNLVEMPAPDPDAVKAFLEAHNPRGKHYDKMPFDLGEDFPSVNAEYLLDLLQLFPGASWYVLPDIAARLTGALFIVHDQGTACLLPVVDAAKMKRHKLTDPTEPYSYFVYARLPGDKKFSLADPSNGKYQLGKLYAPRYKESQLDQLKELLDQAAAVNPGAEFQARRLDCKTVIYTAVPTFSPELFARTYAA